MALKAIVTKEEFEALTEQEQAHFSETDGLYALQVTETQGLQLMNPSKLKDALSKERKNAKAHEKRAKEFESQFEEVVQKFEGIEDPKAAREAMQKVTELKDWDPEKKLAEGKAQYENTLSKKYKTQYEEFTAEHGKKLSAAEKRAEAMEKKLRQALIETHARDALEKAKGSSKLLLPHILKQTRMAQKDDGDYGVEVIDNTGEARLSPNPAKMSNMTVEELIEEMKNDNEFARAFDGSNASGGGATGADGQPPSSGGGPKKSISIKDQQALDDNLQAIASGEIGVTD